MYKSSHCFACWKLNTQNVCQWLEETMKPEQSLKITVSICNAKPNMEILLSGNTLQIFLIIFPLQPTSKIVFLLFTGAFLLSLSLLIRLSLYKGFRKYLMMARYVIWCGVIPKKTKLDLQYHLGELAIYSGKKFLKNFCISTISSIYLEPISFAHRAINYCLKICYRRCGRLLTTFTEWEI